MNQSFPYCLRCGHAWVKHSEIIGCIAIIERGWFWLGPMLCECHALPIQADGGTS